LRLGLEDVEAYVRRFDPSVPVERATTPPSSWYTSASFHALERQTVLSRGWLPAGRTDQLARPGDYVSGESAGEPYLVIRGDDGALRGFFNVCRHHATCLVEGDGTAERLVCGYHGWTYDRCGHLLKAPRLGKTEGFRREDYGLVPLHVGTWGPFVFVRMGADGPALEDVMRPLEGRLAVDGMRFVARKTWTLDCNWKVFADNYLDGGYHVSRLHPGLAGQLDLDSYTTELFEYVSIQSCRSSGVRQEGSADFPERLGESALYAYVYPAFAINRYGPMMDTNWVVPLGPDRTLTVFDYYVEAGLAERDPGFLEQSLRASEAVQLEDVAICHAVQRGLGSSAYDVGRYAAIEVGAHHFHRLLAADLARGI
jgi:choline monooxygenase